MKRLFALLAAGLLCSAAAAQTWPQKPVRIVIPYGAGSSPDVFARLLSERLGPRLGQPVIVENRVGAGGNVGTGYVAKAAPDGYTLLVSTNGPLVNNTVLSAKLPYDPFRELTPIVLGGWQANICATRADSGLKTMKDLVDALKREPGRFNYASIGVGSLSHLGVELLKARTGTYAVHLPYPSSPAAVMSVLQGDIQFTCVPAVAVVPQVKAGRVNALAVSTAKRIPQLPEVPTMREAGYPDAESAAWMAVMAPAGTPPEIVRRLNGEINTVLQMPEMRERMANAAMEPVGGSVEQVTAHLRDELKKWTPIIRRSGASLD